MTRVRLAAWHAAVLSALGAATTVNCGGVSASSDDAGGAGGTAGNRDFQRCLDPMPVVVESDVLAGQGGQSAQAATGYVQCADGWMHRSEKLDCPSMLPRAESVGDLPGSCRSDADCTEAPEGYCYALGEVACGPPQPPHTVCIYGCTRDEQCGAGMICFCGVPTGRCMPADCTSDADCGGLLCASSDTGFACQTSRDECMTNSDCSAALCKRDTERNCVPDTSTGGSCGRPFLVRGEARSADVRAGSRGWLRLVEPDLRSISRTERARLAEHWTAMARMEHASVAAFARFTLELVSLGAPAELVEGAQRAMGDEIEHARLCFGLASAYGERAIGPGPLSVAGALDGRSFETIVLTAILEACVGETLAAVEAEDAAERASDPEVRVVLARIACDEARHAELGFHFLAWAAERAEPRVRERIARAFDGAVRAELAACDTPLSVGAGGLAGHGMPSPAERRAVRELALREILAPAARSLAARAGVASTSRFEPALA